MTLTPYQVNILTQELRKPDYDGKTVDEAFTWLCEPPGKRDDGVPLPPRLYERFQPRLWPEHIGPDGNESTEKYHCQFCNGLTISSRKCSVCNMDLEHPDPDMRSHPSHQKIGPALGLHGMPNTIERDDFDTVWGVARP